MSRKTSVFVVLAAVASFAIACGNDNPPPLDTGNDTGVEDTIVPEDVQDTFVPRYPKDLGEKDDTVRDEGQDTTVQDTVQDVNVDVDVEDDVKTDVVEDTGIDTNVPPMCPCDTTVNEPVCGIDEVTYNSASCAACALCADAPDCPGCEGDIECLITGETNFLLRRTSCDECPCDLVDECDAQSQPIQNCGKVCDIDGVTEFDDLCALKAAKGCVTIERTMFSNFGECIIVCEPCEGMASAPLCGADGNTYNNKCEINNCPVGGSPVTVACNQACPCP